MTSCSSPDHDRDALGKREALALEAIARAGNVERDARKRSLLSATHGFQVPGEVAW